MGDTVNTAAQETGVTAQEPERTFTQAELDAIVTTRLAREREKYAGFEDYKAKAEKYDAAEEATKSEIQKQTERADALQAQLDSLTKANTVREIRAKVSAATGVPADLLSGDSEESCTEQANAILSFAKPSGYPRVKDSGEVAAVPSGKTREQFRDWFDKQIQK